MFISIGTALVGLVGKKASQKVAKVVGVVAFVLALLVLFNVAKCAYDRSIIEKHDAGINVEKIEAVRGAEQSADENAAKAAVQRTEEVHNTQGAISNAQHANPEAARRPSGPVTNAALDELRRQQKDRVR